MNWKFQNSVSKWENPNTNLLWYLWITNSRIICTYVLGSKNKCSPSFLGIDSFFVPMRTDFWKTVNIRIQFMMNIHSFGLHYSENCFNTTDYLIFEYLPLIYLLRWATEQLTQRNSLWFLEISTKHFGFQSVSSNNISVTEL